VLLLIGGVLAVAACGSDATGLAVGADVDRPPSPAMDLVRFENVAADAGLVFRHGAFQFGTDPDPAAMMGGGLCWIDYDRDGWLDLYATNTWSNGEWGEWRTAGGLPQSRLYRNDVGSFVDVTDDAGAGLETRANGCVAADLDLDGWTDLYVTTDRENVLLWNDGGDGFVADGDSSGADEFGWHSGAAVGDVDGNGWPDLFVAGYTDLNRPIVGVSKGFPNTSEPEPDLLFLNDGPPESGGARISFREVAADVGIEPNGADYGLGAVLSDLDGDHDLDLYVANDTTPNQLYENVPADDGVGFRFAEIGADAGVDDTGAGMGVASGDGNGDGRPDLVVTNQLEERHGAWWNVSDGGALTFEDARPAMGFADLGAGSTGWGVVWADIDLDTDLDLFFAHGAIPVRDLVDDRESALLLENHTADGRAGAFSDASSTVELNASGPFLARGAAAADYDNDGDVDLAMGTIGGDLVLLRNTGAGGNWLLVAPPTPSPGTRVTVTLADGTVMVREIHAGSSYLSSEDPRAHFGLGTADRAATVVVDWPDGSSSRYDDVVADQILQVEPGDGE
jgi:hypothetical protein